MKQNRILLCVVLFLMIFNILVPVLYAQQPLSEMSEEERNQKIKEGIEKIRKEKAKYQHPKMDDVLVEIEDEYKKSGEDAAKRLAAGEVLKDEDGNVITKSEDAYKKGGLEAVKKKFGHDRRVIIKEGNKIWVDIYLIPDSTFDRAAFERLGGELGEISSISFGALIPIDKIRKIADEVEGIQHIYMPEVAWPSSYQSEGLSQIRFANYSAAGIKGSGVKVAVIDLGFAGLNNAITNGDLPSNVTKILCGGTSCASTTFSSETEKHGTAVAEIIYDMAKEAQLYLIKIDGTKESLKTAKDYCFNNQIKIINESLNWYNQNFYDGVCHNDNSAVCTAKDAVNNRNILWINSAGNEAKRHYEATYSAPPGSECHLMPNGEMPEFDLTWDDINSGKTLNAYLTWNAWPTTYQNYDIYIMKDLGFYADGSIVQSGTKPVESISWVLNPFTADIGTYQICVNKVSATSNHNFELFIDSSPGPSKTFNTGSYMASGSLLGPADAAEVLAVGAIDYTKWTTGPQESFSSQGPTNAATPLVKPDIMGPDFVTTYTYGSQGFPGTSAAAPHVAGAAALILSKTGYSVSQLWNSLTGSAIPMLSNESNCYGSPNNCYGYGRLQLPALYNINVTKTGTGSGTVTSNITGINCGSKCSDSFISGSTVTLTATPDAGSLFQWSGACSGQSCQITMNGDKAATATFYLPTLSVSKTGAGNGTITSSPAGVNCGATCTANYNAGTPVTLSVAPDTGSTFLGWSGGGCSGTGSCIVTMNDSTSVSTSFGVNTATCPNSVARIVGKSNYTSLQNAYNAAADGDTIQSQAVTLNENVNANRNISVTIDGGYNCYYSSNPGSTALKGSLTTSSGTVNIKNFNLQF